MKATFDKFEIEMTKAQAYRVSHAGQCIEDVRELVKCPAIRKQLVKINTAELRKTLSEYGAWNNEELSNLEDNFERITWIAGNDIVEGL